MGRNDTVLVLKPTANRGDCLSHIGVAREVAAALGVSLRLPRFQRLEEQKIPASSIAIQLEAGDRAPQFFGAMIEGVKIGPSPKWLVERLEAIGQRSK
jgi:phenylalanyl-tRNA synthetase beta chain